LDEESSRKAFRNEYDFDSPDAIDFDVLVDRLRDLKAGYGSNLLWTFINHKKPFVCLSLSSIANLIIITARGLKFPSTPLQNTREKSKRLQSILPMF